MKAKRTSWQVKVEEEASKVFEGGILTDQDRVVIRLWAQTVVEHGPEELLKRPDRWEDHALHGEWEGYRSSRFSYQGRIIYQIQERIVTVIVVRITPDHDYKKEKRGK